MEKKYIRSLSLGLALAIHIYPGHIKAQEVSCFAGNGMHKFADGPGVCSGARLSSPSYLITGIDGNLYVSDTYNNVIRKITPGGMVSTFAGTGESGSKDGAISSASFNYPAGLAMDASGNIFVVDRGNNKIRKISVDGIVSTIAGSGERGDANGAALDAKFDNPSNIALDASGNFYISDTGNNKIKKLTSDGIVSTFAGGGPPWDGVGMGTSAYFNTPASIVIDNAGNLIVADVYNHRLKKITPDGYVSQYSSASESGFADGNLRTAKFRYPRGLVLDASDNLYVTDGGNRAIRKITKTGIVTTIAGNGTEGTEDGFNARFLSPLGLTLDNDGNLYTADNYDHKIRKISTNGEVSTVAGNGTYGNEDGPGVTAIFNHPSSIAIDPSNNLYLTDALNHRIRKITPDGVGSVIAGSGSSGDVNATGTEARFNNPAGIAVDRSGNMYVADANNNKIKKITPEGIVTTVAGSGISGNTDGTGIEASFSKPAGVAVDKDGTLYISDSRNHTIRKITSQGIVSTIAGSGSAGNNTGTGKNASFNTPCGIAVDASGNLYVADMENHSIKKISKDGTVTILAYITSPNAIYLNSDGSLYVTSKTIHIIYKVNAAGNVFEIAGNTFSGDVEGDAALARFYTLTGITADTKGNLFVVDSDNSKIKKVGSPTVAGISDPNNPNTNQEGALIFPNPVRDRLNVKTLPGSSYEIINLFGVILKDGQIDNNIDVTSINPGIYLLKIKTGQGTTLQQFVKE